MNLTEKERIPQLRFPEFSGVWERSKFRNVFDRVTRKNKENSQNVLTISAQHGLVSQERFFSKVVAAKDITNYYLLHKDDFAYNKSYSSGYPMGAIKRLKAGNGVVSTLYICFSANEPYSANFFEQYFESGNQNSEIQKVAQEGARNHGLLNIGVEDFFNIELRIPEKAEQEKIADFLSAVDQKIDLENQKLENLEKYKKSITQQILTQKLRFSEFTGLINMKKIKDCKGITVKKGRALSSSDLVSGNYPVVAGGKTSPYSHNDYTNENAVTISASGAYAGYISYHKGRFWASDCSVVECDHNYNDMVFVYNALLINQGDIYSCQTGGAQPHVYPDNIKNIRIWLPELDEQQKIAGFLSSIDEKTDLQKTKLDHLKTFKKSLLQRMFV